MSAHVDEVAGQLIGLLERSIPEFLEDADIAREATASAHGNIDAMLSVFRGETSAEDVDLPPEVVKFAVSVARRRLPLERLVQSYRVGQTLFSRAWMDRLAEHTTDQQAYIVALHRSFDQLNTYLDRVTTTVVTEYERERTRWLRGATARRNDLIARLLRSESVALDITSRQLGHELRAPQTGLVAWMAPSGDVEGQIAALEAGVAVLAHNAGIRRALTAPMGTSAVWAWFAGPVDLERLVAAAETFVDPDILLAAGDTVTGEHAFRITHEQAVRAQHVASRMAAARRLTPYSEIATLALLTNDEDHAREFVARTLGGLARQSASAERLRETLRVFLEEGGNTRRASERLFTHRNTVRYRLRSAEAALEQSLTDPHLDIEIALLLADAFGDRMLSPGSTSAL